MILTKCAVCATELGLSLGKKCGRCSTRYCGPECQVQHWKEGGHDQLCKKIKKAGCAEQFHANTKYAEAVGVAVEACRGRHEGQKCYICLEAVHARTGEGLVRGCACGDRDGVSSPELGVAHVSCLAEQAKILVEEAEENNLRGKVLTERFSRWYSCNLCEQKYHGVVRCALGWACWKTYVGRPESDWSRAAAMTELGNGLSDAKHNEDALSVRQARLSLMRRIGDSESNILIAQGNLANTYKALGRLEEAIRMRREVYSGWLKLKGEEHYDTLREANNYAMNLLDLRRFKEVKAFLRKTMSVARRVLGEGNDTTLRLRCIYGQSLYRNDVATLDDLREAVATLEDAGRTAQRVLGGTHPVAMGIEAALRRARAALRAREAPGGA